MTDSKVITRFPPSPTGNLHMGSARTALFNFLYAKSKGGKMVLRMEDTDKERSKREYEEDIVEGLNWLGIEWEGKVLRQSERVDVYKEYIKKLIDSGFAYEAEENKDKTGKVIRFKNPNKTLSFNDSLRGEIAVDTTDLGDFVIARDQNSPLYHLAVVVDDACSGVTHVIRGEDGLANTPRQILLIQALGFDIPEYTHIPFILGPDKAKLSKRHGAVSVMEYKKRGYLKEAVINFLAMLGWRSKSDDEKEIWTMEELIFEFDMNGFQKSPAVFNEEKLRWINKEHLKNKTNEEFLFGVFEFISPILKERILNMQDKDAFIQDLRERISVYGDIEVMEREGEFEWLFDVNIEPEKLIWKKSDKEETKKHLTALLGLTDAEDVQGQIMEYAQLHGKGNVLWPLRYALSGMDKSPSPFVLIASLDSEDVKGRLKKAVDLLD